MKKTLGLFIAIFSLLWAVDVFINPIASGDFLWVLRGYAMYYTGVIAISLMGLVIVLSGRPLWAERAVGGMDQVYKLHKWAGILATFFAALHWLIKLAKPLIIDLIGDTNRAAKVLSLPALLEYKSLAKSFGEWAIYAALIMLVLTLWKSFPYKFWRHLHRIMPVLFLMLVFHTVVLMPLSYWTQPIGLALGILLVYGIYGSFKALTQRIGMKHRYLAQVVQAEVGTDQVLHLRAQVDAKWPNHQPGQFAFITFNKKEGGHPFTIASAPNPNGHIDFRIKALGDYTRHLAKSVKPRQFFQIEGPYGCFNLNRVDQNRKQLWVAGGVGITPFIAWLEELNNNPQPIRAQLHYSIHHAENSQTVIDLKNLVKTLPHIQLYIHNSAQNEYLSIEHLLAQHKEGIQYELWFCGPTGLLQTLEKGLHKQLGKDALFVHSEAFNMR